MKTLKEIHEGFFDNIGAECRPLDNFLKGIKNNIVTLKGKDYIIYRGHIFDCQELKNMVYWLLDRNTIKINKDLKKYREIINISFSQGRTYPWIEIEYKFYSLSNIANNITPSSTYESFKSIGCDDNALIEFLKNLAK